MNRRFAFRLAAIPLALGLGGVAARLAFPHLQKPSGQLAQPLIVVTSWGWSGFAAWGIFAATMTLAGFAYLAVLDELRASDRDDRAKLAPIAVASAAAVLATFAFPFVLSSDTYAYAAYGALAFAGENPYRMHIFEGSTLLNVPFTAGITFEWPSVPGCVYGPLFVELMRGIVALAHQDLGRTIAAIRGLVALAFVGSIVLIARFFPGRATLMTATLGLNPVICWSVVEGHNDALVFFIVTACGLAAAARPMTAGFFAAASTVLKATGGLAALALGYALGSPRFALGAIAGVGAGVVVQLATTFAAGGYQAQVATDYVGTKNAAIAIGIRGFLALAAAAVVLYHAGTGSRPRALAAGALVIWALLPHTYAWYGLWLLPLAGLTLDTAEGPALVAATFCGGLRYLSDAYGLDRAAPWLGVVAATIPVAILLGPALASAWRTRPAQRTLPT